MTKQKIYFDLEIDSLRVLGKWAADCADRVLPIFEAFDHDDVRPQKAIKGIRIFAEGGKRQATLRRLAMDAYRAALETSNPAASAAAQAASLAASSAFTHPLVDVQQTKHILGPAAYAALAVEISHENNPQFGQAEVRWAIDHVQQEICEILLNMPKREPGKSRVDQLMLDLDFGLRDKYEH